MAALPGLCARGLLLAALLLLALAPPVRAQTLRYEYDPLGRLVLVAAPEGVARYEYDAVGNLLRIVTRRYGETTAPVAILMLAPDRGPVGTEVRIYGKGFGETTAANQVAFAGAPATVVAASATRLTVTVPPGAASGPVTVTAPAGSAISPEPFTVPLDLLVVPGDLDLVVGSSFDFRAEVGGSSAPPVTWRVNGIVGGNAVLGIISPEGLYSAPRGLPPVLPLSVEAVLVTDPAELGRATVRVVALAAGLVGSPPLTVAVAAVPAGQVAAVPVGVAPPAAASGQVIAAPLVVAGASAQSVLALAGPLAVTAGPLLGGVIPGSGPRGGAVPLSLGGDNLQGATAVLVLRDGLPDATVTASGVSATGDGTALNCTVTILGTALPGVRVLQVVTPQGRSTPLDIGTNTFAVTAP